MAQFSLKIVVTNVKRIRSKLKREDWNLLKKCTMPIVFKPLKMIHYIKINFKGPFLIIFRTYETTKNNPPFLYLISHLIKLLITFIRKTIKLGVVLNVVY